MKPLPFAYGLAAFAALAVSVSAQAAPTTDQNLGQWLDNYDDSFGVADQDAQFGAFFGQSNIAHDVFGRVVKLADPVAGTGYFFTTPIVPSSFQGWSALYLDYTASVQGQVTVEVWNASTPGSEALIATVPLVASDDSAFDAMANISGTTIPAGVTALRVRVVMKMNGSPIGPTLTALRVNWKPKSVLAASLEAPGSRATGDAIQLRFPVSVSYVNATSFVAYVTAIGVEHNGYNQVSDLLFDGATLGGQWNPGPSPVVVNGVSVPPQSVYWSLASQQAGKTYAYNATFRSRNGLVNGIAYKFVGNVNASNAATVATTQRTVTLTSAPSGALNRSIGGAFYIGGIYYADYLAPLTYTVSPVNFINGFGFGAQTYFAGIVYEDVSQWRGWGSTPATITPLNGGTFVTVDTPVTTSQGTIVVPANSIWWNVADLPPGTSNSFQYTVTPHATSADYGRTVTTCATVETRQLDNPPESNFCSGFGCEPQTRCENVIIGIRDDADWGFSKGDIVNGAASVTPLPDNENRFITWGQAGNFRMYVVNGGASGLNDMVVYDSVPADTTFVSATIPAGVGTVYYWQGGMTPTHPELFSGSFTPPFAGWSTTPPNPVTWIAYHVPRLRSPFFAGSDPTNVSMDLTVQTPSSGPNSCSSGRINNTAYAVLYRYTPLTGGTQLIGTHGTVGLQETEGIDVRALVPSLRIDASGSGSVEPGQTASATFNVVNSSTVGNPIDTARNVRLNLKIPTVTANGFQTPLAVTAIDSGGGSVTLNLPDSVDIRWTALVPNSVRTVRLTYLLPTGIANRSTFTTIGKATADDDCGAVSANGNYATSIASEPVLLVEKDVDFRVVGREPDGSSRDVTYTLTYRNSGTAPSTHTWIADRIADGTTLIGADFPEGGEVWFSDDIPPYNVNSPTTGGLPAALRTDFEMDDAVVRAHFTPGVDDGSGFAYAPAGTKWVAWLVDDSDLPVTIFPSGDPRSVHAIIQVNPSTPTGALVVNEAAINADSLEQSIGNRVNFLVSDDPGIDVSKTCAEVVSVGEPLVYTILFHNDTTNPDDTVTVIDTLPTEVVLDADPFIFDPFDPLDEEVEVLADGRTRYTWTFPSLLADDGTGSITVSGRVRAGIQSGTFVSNEVIATAENESGASAVFDECTTLVENADLVPTKLVDQPAPKSTEQVTYTLSVVNENQKAADNVIVRDILPTGLAYVGGSLRVLTPGWYPVSPDPGNGAHTLVLRFGNDAYPSGQIPGRATVAFTYVAEVAANVPPGTSLTNSVLVTTPTGEDDTSNNTTSVTVTTPLPDVYVSTSATPLVKAGDPVQWTLLYGNDAREDASNTFLTFSLPQAPVNDGSQKPDFSFVSLSVPDGVQVWYSAADLDARPTITPNPVNPGAGWSQVRPTNPSHFLFVVTHCDPDGGNSCDLGDIHGLLGPFEIQINGVATKPSGGPPPIGQTFEVCADINMLGSPPPREGGDGVNNHSCATTRTPGVDLQVEVECSPDGLLPGHTPGATATFLVSFENTGTQPAYGVSFDVALAAQLGYEFDDADIVSLTDEAGQQVAPIGPTGSRLTGTVRWTKSGTRYVLGPAASYTDVGLKPGDHGQFMITARVKSDVLNNTDYASVVLGDVLGRPGDTKEEFAGPGSNNEGSCGSTVYRADVFVVKHVKNVSGPNANIADGGDTLEFTIEYGNAGRFPAAEVVMSDNLSDGLTFVSDSFKNIPVGSVFEYDDGTGDWTYQPTSGTDPAVRAVRVRYDDEVMDAPANAVFVQTSVPDFDRGTYSGTFGDEDIQGVRAQGVDLCADVICGGRDAEKLPKAAGASSGTFDWWGGPSQYCYTQAYFPEGECCQHCCPTADEQRFCEEDLEDEQNDWDVCNAEFGPEECGPRPTLEMCYPEGCENVDKFCWADYYYAPESCEAGSYVPDGQCNSDCCPTGKPGSSAFSDWQQDCFYRADDAYWDWWYCSFGNEDFNDCGPQPSNYQCYDVPAECDSKATGTYDSPLFPTEDEGNVLGWGSFIAHVVLGEELQDQEPQPQGTPRAAPIGSDDNETNTTSGDMYVEIFGIDEDGDEQLLKTLPMVDGENVEDLSDIDPSLYPELYMRAYFISQRAEDNTTNPDGNETCGLRDIADGDYNQYQFFGVPTAMSNENQVVGYANWEWRYWEFYDCWNEDCHWEDANYTAWAWDNFGGDDTVGNGLHDLHDELPDGGWYWGASEATDINDKGDIVGWAVPRQHALYQSEMPIFGNPCVWYPWDSWYGAQVTESTAILWQPSGNGGYTSMCLPQPPVADAPADWEAPYQQLRVAPMYINDQGWIAGTAHAHETNYWKQQNDYGISIGQATTWCTDGFKWYTGNYGPGIVTGFNESYGLVTSWQAENPGGDDERWSLRPTVLELGRFDQVGCPVYKQHDLVAELDEEWDGYSARYIYALEVNDRGDVLTMREDPFYDGERWIYERWERDATGHWHPIVLQNSYDEDYTVPQTSDRSDSYDRGTWYIHYGNAMAPNGDVYLQGWLYDEARGSEWYGILYWPAGSDTGSPLETGVGDDFENEEVAGVSRGAIVGSSSDSYYYDSIPTLGTFDHSFEGLGQLGDMRHVATEVDDTGSYVVGAYEQNVPSFAASVQNNWRTFVWERCPEPPTSEFPQLLDWTVTYQTDKNPSWTFQASLDNACRTSIGNTVETSTTTPEITLENNSSSTSMSVNTADLALELEVDKSVVEPGDELFYSGRLVNNGPGPVRFASLQFNMPSELDLETMVCDFGSAYFYEGADIEPTASFYDANQLFGEFGDGLQVGDEVFFEGYCTVMEETPGVVLVASVSIDSPTIDCIEANNDPTAVSIVGEFPNLFVGIDGPDSATAGSNVDYEVSFGNNGNIGTGASILVTAPSGLVFVAGDGDGTHTIIDNHNGTVTIKPHGEPGNEVKNYLDEGEADSVILTYTTPGCAGANQSYAVGAVITATAPEAFINDNQATTSTLVTTPLGQLAIDTELSVPRAEAGQEVVYTIHYANTGSETIYDAALNATLPSGLTLVSAQPIYTTKLGRLISTGAHVLLPGDRGATVVRAIVNGAITGTGSVTMTAGSGACAVSANLPPLTLATPSHGIEVLVSSSTGSHCPAERTRVIDWVVSVNNTSDTAQSGVVVTVPLPADLELVAGSLVPASGTSNSGVLLWTVNVPARGIVNLGFRTKVKATAAQGMLWLTAKAGNVQGTGALALECQTRAVVSKAWAAGCAVPGQGVGVTLTVRNASQTIIRNATLVDRVPKGMTAVASTDNSYTVSGGVVTFPITEILPGQSRDFTWALTMGTTSDLRYGSPIVNRAVLLANGLVVAASNQVGGAIADCNDGNTCTVDSCETFQGCVATFTPKPGVPEICDGIDNDCDNFLDQADEDLVKTPCEDQDGVCLGSVHPGRLCNGFGGWGMCDTAAYQSHDVRYATTDTTCDGIDNDCSTQNDEDYVPVSQSCGIGECQRSAPTTCEAGKVVGHCVPGTPVAEVCDTKDNDCDGLLDGADFDLVLVNCEKQGGVCLGSKKPRTLCVAGSWLECGDAVYAGYAFPNYSTSDANCDGLDNDCDSTVATPRIDEEYVAPGTSCGVGECADNTGLLQCVAGHTSNTCDPLAGAVPEKCNSLDDDCDSLTDETFPNLGQGCDPNPNDGNQCMNGVQQCKADGSGTTCVQQGDIATERCDAIDNDCDGQTDEGCDDDADDYCDGGMVCITGINIPVCPNGCGDCNDTRFAQNPGALETCNNIDDNCNAQTDEGCDDDNDDWCDAAMGCTPIVSVCNKGCGDCVDTNQAINPAATETCNNLDDNCNTKVDEGFGTGVACTAGEGRCEADGLTVCNAAGNGVTCDATPAETGSEICNSDDDDCDGETDEGFGTGVECFVGLGECRRPGTVVCADAQQTRCSAQPGQPTQEVCDGKDNNCNGATDESPQNPEVSVCPSLDTIIDDGPPSITSQTTASFLFHDPVTPANTQFQCSLDGTAWVDCDGPQTGSQAGGQWSVSGLEPGAHTLLVRAVGADGGVDPTPDIHAWVIDTDIPDTFIDVKPQNPSQTGTATFVFSANIPESEVDTYYCVLDPTTAPPALAEYVECDKLEVYEGLAEGPHDMWVYVVNTAGTKDPTPAHYHWVIDTSLPDTIITKTPDDPTKLTSAIFDYTDPDAPDTVTFQCRLDGGQWERCDGKTRTYTGLAPGEHVFEVATIDPNGNVDPSPAVYIWVIDTDPPDTFIPIHPDNPSQDPTAVFGFDSDEEPVTYQCVLDPAHDPPLLSDFHDCNVSETFANLDDGFHTIFVFAVDEAGNADPTPASYEWVIDTTFPETQITTGPATLTGPSASADFTYRDPVTPSNKHFECSLDDGQWTTCDNGATSYPPAQLGLGPHELQVRTCVTQPLVQCDPTPAIWVWEVTESTCPLDQQGPVMTCAADPIVECTEGFGLIGVNEFMPLATDACTPVDISTTHEGDFALGTTPVVWVAVDGNGNRSTCVTSVVVTDTLAPNITCEDDVAVFTPTIGCAAAVELPAPATDDACTPALGLLTYNDAPALFPVGDTTVTWTVVDPAGNHSSCAQKVTVTDNVPLEIECLPSFEQEAPADFCYWHGTVPATATDNCALDQTTLDQTKDWQVGATQVDFSASDKSGNTGECFTALTIHDVTDPVPACGVPVGPADVVPQVVRATATDACGVEVAISAFSCEKVDGAGNATPAGPGECPVAVNGVELTVDGRYDDGILRVKYTVDAVDPSENSAQIDCVLEYDPDLDDDGIVNADDNCVDTWNSDQADGDEDQVGDVCDVCPSDADAGQLDSDGDGLGDVCDNCAADANEDQGDFDSDGVGNACDVCRETPDPDQADGDANGIGDQCQDTDEDGVLDINDNCVAVPNEDQSDMDDDHMGDACDDEPWEGLVAEGDGSCSGGDSTALALAFAGAALALARSRRRFRARSN